MTINDLTLHPRTKTIAEHLIKDLPHALIIDGPAGVGVSTLAKAIAQTVGSAEFMILPKKPKNGELVVNMEEGSVVIDDIRRLYSLTRTKQPEKQVYILDTGNKSMTHGAQNAFLKLLEEPRENLHFIIATHHFDQLLPTITSRSQRLSMLPVTDTQTTHFLKNLGIDDQTKATRLAFIGRGKPALMLQLLEDTEAYEARTKIMTDAKAIISGKPYEKLVIVHQYANNRPDSLTLLEDIVHLLATLIRSTPNKKFAETIDASLKAYDNIQAGGNIKLHLASSVL